MLPGGMDPRQMQRLMQQMGMQSDDIKVKRVVFELEDGNNLVFDPAQVVRITMQGQKSYQVTGVEREEAAGPSEEDIDLVVEQTGATREEAKGALEETEDIAAAIMRLKREDANP